MDLLLWRHAEAEDGIPDLKRRLTARGEKQAQQIAEWLHQHAPKKLRILVSPALRCQQTAKALGLPFETDKRLGTDGNVASLLAAVLPYLRERRMEEVQLAQSAEQSSTRSPL